MTPVESAFDLACEFAVWALDEMAALTEENVELLAEVRSLDIALQVERSRRCIGGTPPGYLAGWANVGLGSPGTASDESAPPLIRKKAV